MPLAQLYGGSPMAEYASLPWGAQVALAQDYKDRQQVYTNLQDVYNKQVTSEYNPQEISRMGLANQQQEYMMPTYEAQGMAAQAKMDTPDYYGASARADVSGFGVTQAENANKRTEATAMAPYVSETATTKAQTGQTKAYTEQQVAQMQQMVTALSNPRILNASDAEVTAWVRQRMPNQSASFEKGMKQAGGWAKFAPIYQAQLNAALQQTASSDPKHMQEMAQKGAGIQPRSPTDFESYKADPKGYAAFKGAQDTTEIAILELAGRLAALEKKPVNKTHIAQAAALINPPVGPTTEVSSQALVRQPDGTYRLEQSKEKGPAQPAASPKPAEPTKGAPKKEPLKLPPGATLK